MVVMEVVEEAIRPQLNMMIDLLVLIVEESLTILQLRGTYLIVRKRRKTCRCGWAHLGEDD